LHFAMASLQGLLVPPFTVCGRINSGAFHKAKAISLQSDAAASAHVESLLPADYDKRLVSLQTTHGGPAFLHTSGVVVYSEKAGFIGDEVALIKWLARNNIGNATAGAHSDGRADHWDTVAEEAYIQLLTETGLTFAFLEITFDSQVIGRLIFELFPDLAPKTCENFLSLCESDAGSPGYVGTPIHRIKPGGWMQGGDVLTGNGDSGTTAIDGPLFDESFHIQHSDYGILGMANKGTHTANSQFYVTFAEAPSFDKKYVAFGKLVDGTKLLRYLEQLDCKNDRPLGELIISDAGRVAKKSLDLMAVDEDAAATRLQAMHRSRLARKEMQEQKKAAARVQAAKRGQMARRQQKEEAEAAVKLQAITRGHANRKRNR